MFIEPIIIYLILVTVFLLSAVLTVVVFTQISIFRKYSEIKRSNEQLRASIIKEEGEILRSAKEKAEGIVAEALRKANKIESSAESNFQELEEIIKQGIHQTIKKYENTFQSDAEKSKEVFQKALNKQIENNIERFRTVSGNFEKMALDSMEAELEIQKEEKLKKLSEKIFEIANTAAKEIINRSLRREDHEELIMEVLEKAGKSMGI